MSKTALLGQLLRLAPVSTEGNPSSSHTDLIPALLRANELLARTSSAERNAFLAAISEQSRPSPYLGFLSLLIQSYTEPIQAGLAYQAQGRVFNQINRNPDLSLPLFAIARWAYERSSAPHVGLYLGRLFVSYSAAVYPSDPVYAQELALAALPLVQNGTLYDRTMALANLSDIYIDQGKIDESIEMSYQALALLDGVEDLDPETQELGAIVSIDLGHGYHIYRGDLVRAQEIFAKARPLIEASTNGPRRGSLALMEGLLALDSGRFFEAEQHLRRATHIYQEVQNKQDLGQVVLHRGRLHLILGEYAQAHTYFLEAEQAFLQAKDETARAEALVLRAQIPAQSEDQPLQLLERAAEIFRAEENVFALALVHMVEGRLLAARYRARRNQEDLAQAHQILDATIERFTQLENPRLVALCRSLRVLAGIQYEPAELEVAYSQVAQFAEPIACAALQQALGEEFERRKALPLAQVAYGKAIDELQRVRIQTGPTAQLIDFLGERRRVYERAFALAASQSNHDALWRYAEEPRAAALLDWLTNAAGGIPVPSNDTVWQEVKHLRAQLHLHYAAQQSITASDGLHIQRSGSKELQTTEAIQNLERQLNALLEQLRLHEGGLIAWQQGEVSNLQAVREALGPEGVLLEYMLVSRPARFPGRWVRELWAIVLTHSDLHTVGPLVDNTTLIALRSDLSRITWEKIDENPQASLQSIYQVFVEPIAQFIPENAHLIIALPDDDPLLQLPIHAAFDGERYLVERHVVSYTPSGTLFVHCQNKAQQVINSVLIAGYGPNLPKLEDEVEAVAASFEQSRQLFGPFRAPKLLQDMTTADLIHLACHGSISREDARYALLMLGPEEYLLAHDWFNTPLQAALVTLSACEVGRERQLTLGMVGGLLAAGAHSVIAALWPTDDEASQFIMQRFYHYLTANPSLGRSAALCQAQRDCLKETAFVAPAYWAPFFLTGSTYPLAFEFSSIPQTES